MTAQNKTNMQGELENKNDNRMVSDKHFIYQLHVRNSKMKK